MFSFIDGRLGYLYLEEFVVTLQTVSCNEMSIGRLVCFEIRWRAVIFCFLYL